MPANARGFIGRMRAYQGSVGVLLRICGHPDDGASGLRQVSEDAVLAANYSRQRVGEAWELPYPGPCKHEFVASGRRLREEMACAHARRRQAAHRPRVPPAHHLLPLIVEEASSVSPPRPRRWS
ncbi:MAG: hypothetical protein R3C32_09000 [Chloroflexota bacterium]